MKRFFLICGVVVMGLLSGEGFAYADTLGQNQTFTTNPTYDAAGADSIAATLRVIGQHAYFYVDDRYWASLPHFIQIRFSDSLNALADEFDMSIYPKSTAFWGSEQNPGIDQDPRIYILFEDIESGSGGYFQTANNYPTSIAPQSNEHEMLYIGTDSVLEGTAKNFIAHELQHLISFNQKELQQNIRDDVWLNEARSEYSGDIVGYNTPFSDSILEQRTNTFFHSPSDSLVEWPNTSADYGIAAVFIQYLADQYGSDFIARTIKTHSAGVVAVDDALQAIGAAEDFEDVFTNWMIASLINNRSVNPQYGYAFPGMQSFRVSPAVQVQLNDAQERYDLTLSLKDWQPSWTAADIATTATLGENVTVRVAGTGEALWSGAIAAAYADGAVRIFQIPETQHTPNDIRIPTRINGAALRTVIPMVTKASKQSADGHTLVASPVTVIITLGSLTDIVALTSPTGGHIPIDGDLIRRAGEQEIYVVWGKYRRYLTTDILKLYGFQDRPIYEVSNEVFARYVTSNYVRAINQEKVYAVWPDGTKHWLHITPAQWDASGRDWNAIFIVNDAEVNSYHAGEDILR